MVCALRGDSHPPSYNFSFSNEMNKHKQNVLYSVAPGVSACSAKLLIWPRCMFLQLQYYSMLVSSLCQQKACLHS